MALCSLCSRRVGSFNEADDTEGLVLRPRDPFELGEPSESSVEAEELLADDECLLSAGKGDPVLVVTGVSSHMESSRKCGSILRLFVVPQSYKKLNGN